VICDPVESPQTGNRTGQTLAVLVFFFMVSTIVCSELFWVSVVQRCASAKTLQRIDNIRKQVVLLPGALVCLKLPVIPFEREFILIKLHRHEGMCGCVR